MDKGALASLALEGISRGLCKAFRGLPDRRLQNGSAEWEVWQHEARYAVACIGNAGLIKPIMAITIMPRGPSYIIRVRHPDETWNDICPTRGILLIKGDC